MQDARSKLGVKDYSVQNAASKNKIFTFDFVLISGILHVCAVCMFAINGLTDR